jgi:hypothetical protein
MPTRESERPPVRLLATLLAVVACQIYWFQRETPTEKHLAEVAGSIAGHEVEVYCPSIWRRLIEISSAQGTAHYEPDGTGQYATLTHEVCTTLADLPEQGFGGSYECLLIERPPCPSRVYDVARSVHVLAHEAVHLSGVHDEALTECYAVQADAALALRLGATERQASSIAVFEYYGNVLAPAGYRFSSDCSSGGRLDLHPETPAWPSA